MATFSSVWDAIEDTPAQAANMRLRSSLMIALSAHVKRSQLEPSAVARLLGVTLPELNDLIRGKINRFELDALINMAVSAGLHVEITIREAIDGPKND